MKIFYLAFACSLLLFSCKKEETCSTREKFIGVDLQSWYVADTIRVVLDGQEIYQSDSVTTLPQLGVAAQVRTATKSCSHLLQVTVNNRDQGSLNFTAADSIYVSVNYTFPERKVVFSTQRNPFFYL